jgi:hypothetical protein
VVSCWTRRLGISQTLHQQFATAFIRFGHGNLRDWTHVLPRVRHAQAKFWDWDDPETQVMAPHREFVTMLVQHGYAGSISSEFGAWPGSSATSSTSST